MSLKKVRMCLSNSPNSPFFRPIWEGRVSPRDIEPEMRKHTGHETVGFSMLEGAYDVAEMSLSMFTAARNEGYSIAALPVFTTRHFMLKWLQLSRRSDVQDLSNLKGKRVGLHLYWNSEVLWVREILREVHGVSPQEIHWITNRKERLPSQVIPPGVTVEIDKHGRDTRRLLVEGEVDAVVGLGPGGLPNSEQVPQEKVEAARQDAYPDLLEAERAYYRRTGVFPFSNVVTIREDLASQEPWVVESLYEMFLAAKQYLGLSGALDALRGRSHWPLPGGTDEDVRNLLGDDPWQYGIEANRRPLEMFLSEAFVQGMIDKPMSLERFFAPGLPGSDRLRAV